MNKTGNSLKGCVFLFLDYKTHLRKLKYSINRIKLQKPGFRISFTIISK